MYNNNNNDIIGVVGDRGSGKTTLTVGWAITYINQGYNVFSNIILFKNSKDKQLFIKTGHSKYILKHPNYYYIENIANYVSKYPEELKNGYIIMDEAHVGGDAYNFLKTDVQGLTQFITQIRKRNLTLIFITQVFASVVKRLRQQTNYIFEVYNVNINNEIVKGYSEIRVYDVRNFYKLISNKIYDNSKYFDYFDTNQVIMN